MPAGSARWGWHQLTDEWAAKVVADAGVRAGELVVDVGAGLGALTQPLLAAGARVIAVELHPARASALRQRFASDPVVVVRADAADLRLPRRPFRVVASPPYGVTTALLRRLLQPGAALIRADLVLQCDAAARWASARAPGLTRWAGAFRVEWDRAYPGAHSDLRRELTAASSWCAARERA